MTLKNPKPSLTDVGQYNRSGVPFITGSTLLSSSFSTDNGQVKVKFPNVSRTITVINTRDVPLRVHFNNLNDGNVEGGRHYITIPSASNSFTFDVMAPEVFVSLANGSAGDGRFEMMVEMTGIPSLDMSSLLTGSGLTE